MTSTAITVGARTVHAPRGTEMSCKTWQAEAAMRMLMNNLDPEVAELPEQLVVYGGRGQRRSKPQGGKAEFRDHDVSSMAWRACSVVMSFISRGT